MTPATHFEIRPVNPADHPAVLGLSPRLTIGAAPWRDPDRVAAAARGWIESSLAAAGQDGHALLVALLGGQVAGLVSLVEREHFTGELDAYIGELVVGQTQEGQGAGRALLAAAERWAAWPRTGPDHPGHRRGQHPGPAAIYPDRIRAGGHPAQQAGQIRLIVTYCPLYTPSARAGGCRAYSPGWVNRCCRGHRDAAGPRRVRPGQGSHAARLAGGADPAQNGFQHAGHGGHLGQGSGLGRWRGLPGGRGPPAGGAVHRPVLGTQ